VPPINFSAIIYFQEAAKQNPYTTCANCAQSLETSALMHII